MRRSDRRVEGTTAWYALLLVVAAVLTSACAGTEPPGPAGGPGPCSPAVTITGFSDALDEMPFAGGTVGSLSALALSPDGRLLALSDRSTMFTLDAATRTPVGAVALQDERGAALDAEAVVVEPDGTRLVTSETEPSVRVYRPDGGLVGRLPVPPELGVAPVGRAARNKTFEGLALQPDGRTLVAAMEGALAGDDPGTRRFVVWRRDAAGGFGLAAEYGYRADEGLDVSDITATGDGRLLVLERSYTDGVGNTVRLYLADPVRAADVGGIAALDAQGGPSPVTKTLLADIASCPTLGAAARQPQPNPLLDNIEGLTVTGRGPDGGLGVLMVSDDNGRATQITRLYALHVRPPPR